MCACLPSLQVPNECSAVATPSVVAFSGHERFIGDQASAQLSTNAANAIAELLPLLGCTSAEAVAKALPFARCSFIDGEEAAGGVAVEVSFVSYCFCETAALR